MNILLLTGGWSSERDVALAGSKTVQKALEVLGHTVTYYDMSDSFDGLYEYAKKHDFTFIALHGCPGEDGIVQAILDRAHCPYQGSGARGSFLAVNKAVAKDLYKTAGIPTAPSVFLHKQPDNAWLPTWCTEKSWPLFVKSNTGGSSLHLYRVFSKEELYTAIAKVLAAESGVLIEQGVAGKEVTCGVLTNAEGIDEALPPVLIAAKEEGAFFDYTAKYTQGAAVEICPAPLEPALIKRIQEIALKAHKCLDLYGYSRTDMMITANDEIFVLETNTLPGMTATSLLPQEAKAIGLEFPQLLERLLASGLHRHRN